MEAKHRELLKSWGQQVQSKITSEEIAELQTALQCEKEPTMHPLQAEEFMHMASNVSIEESMEYFTDLSFAACDKAFGNICIALERMDNKNLYQDLLRIAQEKGVQVPCSNDTPDYAQMPTCDCYEVTSEPRGHILILNNSFFNQPHERRGCKEDIVRLERVFRDLNYTVMTRNDLTKQEMRTEIEEFTKKDYHKGCGAAGVVLMSHGANDGMIYDKKNEKIHVNELIYPLKHDGSLLIDKPVFVLIQACRGNQHMSGTIVDLTKVLNDGVDGGVLSVGETSTAGWSLNKLKDIVIVYSCLPTYNSYRDPNAGAMFIQTFCDVLKENGRSLSFVDIYYKVAAKDSPLQIKNPNNSALVPQIADYLTKTFYLSTKHFLNCA